MEHIPLLAGESFLPEIYKIDKIYFEYVSDKIQKFIESKHFVYNSIKYLDKISNSKCHVKDKVFIFDSPTVSEKKSN